MQVIVRDNNVEQALKALKRKLQREGVFREIRRKKFYKKPSVRKAREKNEALRRLREHARKRAEREGQSPSSPRRMPATSGRPR
jgi:small subunit ribosomal protein S21